MQFNGFKSYHILYHLFIWWDWQACSEAHRRAYLGRSSQNLAVQINNLVRKRFHVKVPLTIFSNHLEKRRQRKPMVNHPRQSWLIQPSFLIRLIFRIFPTEFHPPFKASKWVEGREILKTSLMPRRIVSLIMLYFKQDPTVVFMRLHDSSNLIMDKPSSCNHTGRRQSPRQT